MLKLASILSFYVLKTTGSQQGCHWKVAVGWVGEGGLVVGNESIAFEFLDGHLLLYMYILGTAFIVFSSEITFVS